MRARTWFAFGWLRYLRCRNRVVRRQNSHAFGASDHSASRGTPFRDECRPPRSRRVCTHASRALAPIIHAPYSSVQKAVPRPVCPAASASPSLSIRKDVLQPQCLSLSRVLAADRPSAHRLRSAMQSGEAKCSSAARRGPCMPCRSSNCAHTACAPTHDRPRCRSPLLWTHASCSCSPPGALMVPDGRKFATSAAEKRIEDGL